jgi:8-oxo-dGTP diphosphatase
MTERKKVDVSAAVITRPDGSFLLGQRAPGTFYPGFWEFPGGKVEAGETALGALLRELKEELGILATDVRPWITREHSYEHADVRLHFFEVAAWQGELADHVHSALSWQRADNLTVAPVLPANGPVLKALRLPRVMGITDAARLGLHEQIAALGRAAANGLRLVQVRDTSLPAMAREQLVRAAVECVRPLGGLVLVNGDGALARRCGADGVHLSAAAAAGLSARPDFPWVGAAAHKREELEQAAMLGLDYALFGPVNATPTHPDQPGIGWECFGAAIGGLPMPVLALGGVGPQDLDQARQAGARGIAAIRSTWG